MHASAALVVAVALSLGVSVVAGCVPVRPGGGDGGPDSLAFDRVAEERAVYEAVLRSLRGPRIERFVIQPETALSGSALDRVRPEGLRDDTAADYRRRPAGPMPVALEVGVPLTFFSGAEWDALPAGTTDPDRELDGQWNAFHARFPNAAGHMGFSPVGFSRDGRQALVHIWTGSASLGGAGYFYVLEKRAGLWTVRRREMTAIA